VFPASLVAVGTGVTSCPPRRSRRAAFPHRAPVEGQTRPAFGAWAPVPVRGRRLSGDMRIPALGPEHALALALPSTGRLPSTLSATSPSAGVVRGFIGTMQPSDSSYLPRQRRPSDFLSWPGIAVATAGGMRSPRFRRVPFGRNGVFDHGRAVAPRMTVRNMLPSTFSTVSAPANLYLSRLNNPLHTIAVYASPWSSPSTPQHSLPGDPLRSYPGRTSTGWNAPASPGAPKIYCSELHAILTSGFGKADHGVRQRHDSTGTVPCWAAYQVANWSRS